MEVDDRVDNDDKDDGEKDSIMVITRNKKDQNIVFFIIKANFLFFYYENCFKIE